MMADSCELAAKSAEWRRMARRYSERQQRICCCVEENGKKIKAVSCKLTILLRLNHYDKRVSSIALRAPAVPS